MAALRLSALGGPHTFGGQAAARIRELYPRFAEISYYRTSDEAQEALDRGEVDATCVPEQMSHSGFHLSAQSRVAAGRYVAAEATHAYHCALLARPGASVGAIRRVLGHTGSVTQSRAWLEREVPRASIEIVDTSSFGAAKAVLESDGSVASVGTPEAAAALGLEVLARDIDGGSRGNYWALSARPLFVAEPTRLVVTGRLGPDGRLTALIAALAEAGYMLETTCALASRRALFEYDHVMRFRGRGTLETVGAAVAAAGGIRLAGAFEAREDEIAAAPPR